MYRLPRNVSRFTRLSVRWKRIQISSPVPLSHSSIDRGNAQGLWSVVTCKSHWTPEIFMECYCVGRNEPTRCEITKGVLTWENSHRREFHTGIIFFLFRIAFTWWLGHFISRYLVACVTWRYCVGARLKFWRRSRVPKKGSRDEAVDYITTAPPPNLTRLLHSTASYAN